MDISIYTDGGSRGNPGPSGYGLVVYDQNQNIIYQDSRFLGIKTNNEAEYLGLLAALTWLVKHQSGLKSVSFYSDSQLLVRQITGAYKVKAPTIKPLFATAQSLLSQINCRIKFTHLLRHKNELADQLANQAMDTARS